MSEYLSSPHVPYNWYYECPEVYESEPEHTERTWPKPLIVFVLYIAFLATLLFVVNRNDDGADPYRDCTMTSTEYVGAYSTRIQKRTLYACHTEHGTKLVDVLADL